MTFSTGLALALLFLTGSAHADEEAAQHRVIAHGTDALDALGSASTLLADTGAVTGESGGGGRSSVGVPSSSSSSPSEPYCPPTVYTFGQYREVILECDGAAGTEMTPWLENQEGEDAEQEDGPPGQVLVVSREDVQSLIVDPGGLEVQPDQPWVLVNAETIVMTGAGEHILTTEVLDVGVDVRVTPVLYTWDFGDGSEPVTGTDPGAPWPNHTVAHVYREPGQVAVTLYTQWDAAFQVQGTSVWWPVVGRAVTMEASEPIEVVTATPRLTAD